jgi:solute carrier family 25 (adenine nucleotide translocator) protein 4/5/6/31
LGRELPQDVGTGKREFTGLVDCIKKTASGPKGPAALYNGFGVSVMGIFPYRGVYFGMYDTLVELNPYNKSETTILRLASKFVVAQSTAITAG